MNIDDITLAGKLLVQYKLIKAGIHIFILSEKVEPYVIFFIDNIPHDIQVKTTEKPRPGGGKGKDAVSWNIGKADADYIACVNLSEDEVWLFTPKEIIKLAQHPSKDKLYIYTDETVKTRKKALKSEFKEFLIENRIKKLKAK